MAFKFEVKEIYPIFVFAKCCWSIHSKLVRLGKNAHSKQRKPLPHKPCSFTSSFCTCPAGWAKIYSAFFQHKGWYGPTSEKTLMHRKQKIWLKYSDFTELKNITSRMYSNCSKYSSPFSSPSNFVAVCFLSLKHV